jgi:hypothetical protein
MSDSPRLVLWVPKNFGLDIVVTRPDSPEVLLVVEVKGNVADQKSTEASLKSYMVHMSCPVGMLVTPEQVRFYRNRYTDYAPQTIEMIGECPTRELLGTLPRRAMTESDLEGPVEEWLESLRLGGELSWPSAVREAIESSVLPVVSGGVVRAGGPRWRRAG